MTRRLAIVAGNGSLVPEAVSHARERGWPVLVLAAVPRPDLSGVEVKAFDLFRPLRAIAAIRKFAATDIVMIGGVQVPEAARETLTRLLSKKKDRHAPPQGDAGLSRFAGTIKALSGARLTGIHELLPDLLAAKGHIAGPSLAARTRHHAGFALDAARRIGALDIGQAVVCSGERIIAVEDIAGTDALLERVADYRLRGLTGDGAAPLVLAKAAKPHQPLSIDLPAVGPLTIERAAVSGVSVVAVEAERTLLISRAEMVALANEHGITLFGIETER